MSHSKKTTNKASKIFQNLLNPINFSPVKNFLHSFDYPRQPVTFLEYLHLRFKRKDENFPRLSKIDVNNKILELGLRPARIIRVFNTPLDFDDSGLPDKYVLKPARLWSKRGVMLLTRENDKHMYWETFSRRWLSVEDIRKEQVNWYKAWSDKYKGKRFPLIVEEFLTGEPGQGDIPHDYKLYTFDGEVCLITQYNRNTQPVSLAWFLNDFEFFDYRKYIKPGKNIRVGEPVLPECHNEIIVAAKKVSKSFKTPFIRVDVYATPEGPVIGELAFTSGGPYFGAYSFKKDFDKKLGRAWTNALFRLGHEPPVLESPVPMSSPPVLEILNR